MTEGSPTERVPRACTVGEVFWLIPETSLLRQIRRSAVSIPTTNEKAGCQSEAIEASSSHVPHILDLLRRARNHLAKHGLWKTYKKVWTFLFGKYLTWRTPSRSDRSARQSEEVLNLQPGELVEVKSEQEIAATLDAGGRLHGLGFCSGMDAYCGKRLTVFKRVERVYLEESGQMRRLRNTVLLDGVFCDGLLRDCDRACFFFWREAWLRRMAGENKSRQPASDHLAEDDFSQS